MIEFKDITLADKELIQSFTLNSQRRNCDLSFANLCSWTFLYQTKYAVLDGYLLLRFYAGDELDRLTDLNKEIVIIATTNLFSNFDKALIRRFDATINFDRYTKDDLIEVAEYFFSSFVKKFKGIAKDTRLFRKILSHSPKLPYPGELKNIIKTSLAFSDIHSENDYLRRLYNQLVGNIDETDIAQLYKSGYTVREIEKLKGESKSSISRKLSREA